MSDQKENKCCKDFEDSACLCLDTETGERNCGTDNDDCCEAESNCCDTDNSCCVPKL